MERVVAPTFDTLAVFERLKSADLSETAAKEIAEVLKDVTETNLVTKLDLDLALERTKSDLYLALERTKNDLYLALERTKSDMIRWVAGLMVAQAGVIVALIKLL
jgi:hypothetical protein